MEYEKYQVLDDLPEMTMDDLLSVTDEMMAYLRGNREDLHVFTTMDGEYRSFSMPGRSLTWRTCGGCSWAACGSDRSDLCLPWPLPLFYISGNGAVRTGAHTWPGQSPAPSAQGPGVFFAACLALAAVISTDFSRYFVVFHHIFFDNDLWILDPDTDMLINIVPEAFFMDTALRIAIVFAIFVTIFFGACLFLWLKGRKAAEKGEN